MRISDWSSDVCSSDLIGRPPATQAEIQAEIAALKSLFAGEGVEWLGSPVKPLRFPRPMPIYYSAFGPKALALAGEQADGVILFAGVKQLDRLEQRIAVVRDAAKAVGREDRKSTRPNSSHSCAPRMPSSA